MGKQKVYVTISLTVENWITVRKALKTVAGRISELGLLGDKGTLERVVKLIKHRINIETGKRPAVIEENFFP